MKSLLVILFITGISSCSYQLYSKGNITFQPIAQIKDESFFKFIDSLLYITNNSKATDTTYYSKIDFYNHSDTFFVHNNKNIDFNSKVWIVCHTVNYPDNSYFLVQYNNHNYLIDNGAVEHIITPLYQEKTMNRFFEIKAIQQSKKFYFFPFPNIYLRYTDGTLVTLDKNSDIYLNYIE